MMALARTRYSPISGIGGEIEEMDDRSQQLRSVQLKEGPGWEDVKALFGKVGVKVLGPSAHFV